MKFTFCYPEGKTKALTFSYDDSNPDNARLAAILNCHGMKATFNLNSAFLPGKTDAEKTDFLQKALAGHEIACHGQTHPFFDRMPQMSIVEEVLEDRRMLEKFSGRIVEGMAYPFGTYDANVVNTLRTLGVVYARTVKSTGKFTLPNDFMEWNPTCHHNENLPNVAERFLKNSHSAILCYVWGHVSEFNRDGNWNVIEEFCARLAEAKANIWFATNGEIYDYITAIRRLVTATDAHIVRNPSAQSVWLIDNEGTPHEIKGGSEVVFS